ncbi:MAG: transglutaminase-like domain-containing protein [Bacteroidota bacterium]
MRRLADTALIISLLILGAGVLPLTLPAQQRDAAQSKYNVLRSGSDCGQLTLDFERLANGYMQCEMREERRYQGIDDKPVTWRRSLTILVDSSLQILAVNGREFSDKEESTIKGSCVEGVLYFSREEKDGRVSSWRDDCSSIPDVFLPEFAVRADIPTPDRVFFVHDLTSRAAAVRVSDIEGGDLHIVVGNESEFIVSANAEIKSWSMPELDLAWESDEKPFAGVEPCDIDCGVFWDAGQVTLPTEIDNIRSMDVRLTLTKDVGARLVPEDVRQKIIDDGSGSGAAVKLRVMRTRQKHGEATLPILDEKLAQYQKEGPFLTVTAETIRERAAQLRAMTRNAAAVAGEIQAWMKAHFVEDDFVPLVAADRLVKSPRGTSLHASILLVTLARAAGIPARLVLGFHPDRGRWRSTVWTELWTGSWQSVNSVNGDFIDDASNVKILHASDVADLREQARRLQGAVRLDIIAVEKFDEGAAGKINTGIFNGAYSDRAFKCVVRAPQGWIIEQRVKGTQTDVLMWPEAGSAVRFEMQLTKNPYPLATREVYDAKVMALGVILADAQVLEKGEVRFGEKKAPYVLYSYRDTSPGAGSSRITTADIIFTSDVRGYLFRFTAPSAVFHDYDSVLQDILLNTVILEEK